MSGGAASALRTTLALGVGAWCYRLAFPPHDLPAFAFVALVPLLAAVDGRSSGRAGMIGALAGVAYSYALGAGWLAPALARFFALPLAVGLAGATVYAILFWAPPFAVFAACAARLLRGLSPVPAALAIAAAWVATELLRGRLLGQPWGLLGYAEHAQIALLQVAAVTGVYGVSFLVALVNAALAVTLLRWRDAGPIPLALAGALVGVAGLAGALAIGRPLPAPDRRVAVVQTNVAPAAQWTRAYTDQQVLEHTRATDEIVGDPPVALVVWPENAVPRYLELEPGLAVHLAAIAGRHGADLLFGGPRHAGGRSYNSVRLITAAGRNGGAYDKQRLVLFAEANPFAPAAPASPEENPRQFAAGDGPSVLQSFVPIGVSVCHEILFPELAVRAVGEGAALLVNVSNDGWLDPGAGVAGRQHAAMATFRAVETHRWLVRAATTGVSAVVDPHGRVTASLDVGRRGGLMAAVAGSDVRTPYVRLGDAFAVACAVAATIGLLAARRPVG